MVRRISLLNPWHQYLIGLGINLFYLAILYLLGVRIPDSYSAQQIAPGNIWSYPDSVSYIIPARNFLQYGVFGIGTIPDNFRTIGYPFLLSVFMFLFKSHWGIAVQLFQCCITATLYPLFTTLIRVLFNKDKDHSYIKYVFGAVVFTGVVFTEVNFILTDLIFLVLLYWGILLGIQYYQKSSGRLAILYFAVISFCSMIRPNNSLFPIINIILALWVLKQEAFKRGNVVRLIFTTLVLLVVCNLPSIRNYENYGCFTPSKIIGINLMFYYSNEIARVSGQDARTELADYKFEIDTTRDLSSYTRKCGHYAIVMMEHYPGAAIKAFCNQSSHVLFGAYLFKYIGNNFNYDLNDRLFGTIHYKESRLIRYGSYMLSLFYALLWLLLIISLYELLKQKEYTLVILVAAFFLVYIFPGLFSGYFLPRYRLPFEFFLLTLPIRYLCQHRNNFSFGKSETSKGLI